MGSKGVGDLGGKDPTGFGGYVGGYTDGGLAPGDGKGAGNQDGGDKGDWK